MRVLLVFLLWLLLGIFYWFCQKNCCTSDSGPSKNEVGAVAPVTPLEKAPIKKLTPLRFECSEDEPSTDPEWIAFRDSLIENLTDGSQLQIQGLYSDDEDYDGDLGMARAKNVLKLFGNVSGDRFKIESRTKGEKCLEDELNNLITFRYVKNTAKIKEVDDKTIIYFPFNSTNKISDEEVESYLNDVAKRIVASGEKVRLTGHTDDVDSDAFNMALGERRATVISDYLIRRGVNPNKIQIRSQGERQPIADNKTEEGRASNRRTELEIIK